jgi:hypothetical protein
VSQNRYYRKGAEGAENEVTIMKRHFCRSLILAGSFLGTLSVCVAQPEPKFTVLFPKDGPVTTGWVVRTWANVKDAPEWETIWQVWDGILYGGKSPTHKWVGTWLLSEREYGDFILEVDFKFINGGATGNGGAALLSPVGSAVYGSTVRILLVQVRRIGPAHRGNLQSAPANQAGL